MPSQHFDLLVVGGGTGRDVVLAAEAAGLSVALLEKGPLGGTCHNRGCMPSKMLIHSADLADAVRDGPRFGVHARIDHVDFPAIVRQVFATLDAETAEREADLRASDLVTFFQQEGRFIAPRTMQIGDTTVTADRVDIAGGGRPVVPPIPGLDRTPHLTSDDALRLSALPQRLAIIGGGYVSCELAHFFGALGAHVTMINIAPRLLDREDVEIADWLTGAYGGRYDVRCGVSIDAVAPANAAPGGASPANAAPGGASPANAAPGGASPANAAPGGASPANAAPGGASPANAAPGAPTADDTGVRVDLAGGDSVHTDQLLVATGRRPNSDLLDLAAAGLDLDQRGYVRINEYLETNQENVWALGDIAGVLPLKHVAVREARHLTRALFHADRRPMRYDHIPHAVFSAPQVAAVGRTEEQLRDAGTPYKVGRWRFKDTAMGMALREDGLVKVLASPDDGILGCHIVGPNASILVHQVVVALSAGGATGALDAIVDAVHAHPALSQVVEEACKAAQAAPLMEPAAQPA